MKLSKAEQNIGAAISILATTLLLIYLTLALSGLENGNALLIAAGGGLVITTGIWLFILVRYRRSGSSFMIDYLNIGVQRYILAILMVLYGIDKLLGNFFDYELFALDSKLADVSEFQLAWFFYGKNHGQEFFTGIMEFVPALFLLHRRTYYVAAIVLLPVTAQVVLLNFFFKIGGVTFPVSCILLACNVYILYSQKEKIKQFFRSLNFKLPQQLAGKTKTVIRIAKGTGIFLVCMFILLKIKPVVFKSAGQKVYQGLVGVYTLKEVKKNGMAYNPHADSLLYKDLYIEKQARWNILRKFNDSTEAFILQLTPRNDSISLYLNKGGTGDGPDIIDSATALKGTYILKGQYLTIKGIQLKDTVALVYVRQTHIQPKTWLW